MAEIKTDILVIGGGIAGVTFAENYKRLKPDAHITIVERENTAIYSRVLLPNYVKNIVPRERVFIRKKEQIAELGINYILGENITQVSFEQKTAESQNNIYEYKKLVIAIGGDARKFEDAKNIHYLQTLQDADNLKNKLQTIPPNSKAIVIGGGFIGLELLEIFKDKNLQIINLVKNNQYFELLAPSILATKLINIIKENGVNIVSCQKIKSVNEVEIYFDENKLPFDIAGAGIGLLRNDNLTNKNRTTNEFLELEKDVYLVGDLPKVVNRDSGNWNNAIAQAIWLAKYLSGQINTPFEFGRTSDYSTKIFGNTLVFMGYTNQKDVENKIILDEKNKLIIECYKNKALVGAILLNSAEVRGEIGGKIN